MKKKVLLINDMPGYGKVALSAMFPILSHMGYSVYNLPTALVSNTLDYGKFEILDTTDYMEKTVDVWEQLGFSFECIATGFIVSEAQAALVAALKAVFVLLTRGWIAGLLSASGSLLSLLAMYLMLRLHASYLLLSITGAIFHNIGQLLTVTLWLQLSFFSYYLPVLILSGLGMGLLTGLVLKALMPALRRLSPDPGSPERTT